MKFKPRFLYLGFLLTTFLNLACPQASAGPCVDKKGGWRSLCLQDFAQKSDENANRAYWNLRSKIKEIQGTAGGAFTDQFLKLVRKNELDFIVYSESYCNMQNYISINDTEINKILLCQIKTAELRQSELESIMESISLQMSKNEK